MIPDTVEIIVQCRHCLALETLYIIGDKLERTRRYHQEGNRIMHDCNTQAECLVISRSQMARKESEE